MKATRWIFKFRNQLMIFLPPLLLLPLPMLVNGQEALCGYCMLLLAVYWCTEAVPIEVTGLIPVFLFPMLGLLPVEAVVPQYMKEVQMLFLGGIIVAISLEKNNLHIRIALNILRLIGTQPRWLLFGFMFPTWFLSMWISNTAATSMMLPMVEAVLDQIQPKNPDDYEDLSDAAEDKKIGYDDQRAAPNGEAVTSFGIQDAKRGSIASDISLVSFRSTDHLTESISVYSESSLHANRHQEMEIDDSPRDPRVHYAEQKAHFDRMSVGFYLSVAYAANVGGVATLTGTSPNLILKGYVDDIWSAQGLPSPLDYSNWMVFGMPISFMCFVLVWFWMQFMYLGIRETCNCCSRAEKGDSAAKKTIMDAYNRLGSISFAECMVGILFMTLVSLWFFRDPDFMAGWSTYYRDEYIGDAVPALMIACFTFIIPNTLTPKADDDKPVGTLMTWKATHEKMAWGTLILTGGGFALAEATMKSGLADWIGDQLQIFDALPGWVMVMLLCLIVSLVTNVTSNTAICTLLMPIMAAMAEGLGKNPMYLMLPVCVTTSFAFMLPVGTPPNAIVFASGRIKVMDMVKAGLGINILCVFVITMATETWGAAYFDLYNLPWGNSTGINSTLQYIL